MSYANGTTHYNLPQTVGSDKRDWSDTNKAFADLDAAVYEASAGQIGDAEKISELETAVATNTESIAKNTENITSNATDILTNKQDITGLKNTVTSNYNTLSSQQTDIRQDAEDMITSFNEASATSTHSYEVGDFFIYNDVLYRATSAIAVGDTIVPNTNCEATNVTTELDGTNSDVATLEKRASDTEGYITSYYENDDVADNDYAVDDFVVFNNKLHRVTSAISTGDTMTVGVNCEETTIAQQLKREDMFSVALPAESGETIGEYFTRIAPTVHNLCEQSGRAPLCKFEFRQNEEGDIYHLSFITNTDTSPYETRFFLANTTATTNADITLSTIVMTPGTSSYTSQWHAVTFTSSNTISYYDGSTANASTGILYY